MGPQKGQKCRELLRKCEKLFTGGIPKGEETGHKASPGDVAVRMKELRDSSGKKRFQKKEWLTTLQISHYFSRLSTLNKSGRLIRIHDTDATSPNTNDDEDEDEDEDDVLTIETPAIRTRQQIRREFEL